MAATTVLRWVLLRVYRVPRRTPGPDPTVLGLTAQDVELTSVDGSRLRGWFLPADVAGGPPAPAIAVQHGWGSQAADLLPAAAALVGAGLGVLVLDARGHGRSDPARFMSMPRFGEDLATGVRWLRQRPDVDPDRIGLVGHSVGAGAALLVAADDPRIAGVVTIGSMAHPEELVRRSLGRWWLPRPVVDRALSTIEATIGRRFASFAPLVTIAEVRAPVVVVHGLADRTVPPHDASRLVDAAPHARLRLLAGVGHRQLEDHLPVIGELARWLAGVRPVPPPATLDPGGPVP